MELKLFIEACQALWGPRWQTEAATAFAVSDRTIRRLVAGEIAVNPGFARELKEMIAERQEWLGNLAQRIAAADHG